MENKSDSELVTLARNGDKDAFGLLVRRHQMTAQRLAMRLVSREDRAQELAQEAMHQAYLSLDRLRDPARFKSWLYGIVLNICRSHLREREITFFSLEAIIDGLPFYTIPLFSVPAAPEKMAEERELHRIMLEAINSLTSRDRDAMLLFYYAQLSLQEIAMLMDSSTGAVKVRIHRARQRLKADLMLNHPEIVPREKRRKVMVKVTIADVIKQERKDEEDRTHVQCVIVLQDEAGKRALPIWIGPHEGSIIAMGLSEFSFPHRRPLTMNFFVNLLQTIDAEVEEVRVEALKEMTYYGIVKIRCGKTVSEVDARPSDAIALAVLTGSPIFVAEDVFARAGSDIPPAARIISERKGVEDILKEIEEAQRQAQEVPMKPQLSGEDIKKLHKEVIAVVFRS
ncbi:MAG: bifunctional nuclease family protein [Dehalococcoidales bacterium]|nr:MAG: bifunctional nuclease family protein [Dehalococcoidales bacterium]